MKITSSAFTNNQKIPAKYTCNGDDINPPLQFSEVPQNTKSLVLIVDDPDAPMRTWVHWVVYNINPSVREITENSIPKDGIEAKSTNGQPGFGDICPPSGTHRYFFKLYALNKTLSIKGVGDKETILAAMDGSILTKAELVGLYSQ